MPRANNNNLKQFRLWFYNERERNVPMLVTAERYEFVPMGKNKDDNSAYLLEFYIGDNVVSTVVNFPEVITLDGQA